MLHVREALFVKSIDFLIEGSSAHFSMAVGNDKDGDDVGCLDDVLHIRHRLVKPACFRVTLLLQKTHRAPDNLILIFSRQGLRRQFRVHILVESPKTERIARMHLAGRGAGQKFIHCLHLIPLLTLHRSRSIYDEEEAIGSLRGFGISGLRKESRWEKFEEQQHQQEKGADPTERAIIMAVSKNAFRFFVQFQAHVNNLRWGRGEVRRPLFHPTLGRVEE